MADMVDRDEHFKFATGGPRMTAAPIWLRKTLRFLLLGVAAGIVTSLASIFTVFALAGRADAMTVPIVWALGAMIGAVFGGVLLPLLAMWVLRDVPVRRTVIVAGAATWAASGAVSVIGHGGLGAIAGLVAAVVWLRYLEPALAPVAARPG